MTVHKSVLLKEAIENLKIKSGDAVVDATLGGGGHSREILKKIGSEGILVTIDSDIQAIDSFAEFSIFNFQFSNKLEILNSKIKKNGNIFLVNDNFANLDSILKELKIEKVNAILADFGISSDQLEEADRGFSFQKDAWLDMRMDQEGEMTAEKIANNYPEEELARIFSEYGEEKYARSIAKKIVECRKNKPIERTLELVEIIGDSVPEKYKHQRIHFATRIFQALRIETNKELDSIRKFISKAIEVLDKKGRLAVITFHSGEDKIAKEIFRENARGCICPPNFPVCRCGKQPAIKIITKKPILPMISEIEANPRSRSAKLRIIEKI
ncbi:MAG: 16S rRNA (cytosine(1402)-N(4))-methyltransferase RsmH [Parcubacteria group bacterium]|jgi:16S rRNA (cytosine1402-N4)-methyltransferase